MKNIRIINRLVSLTAVLAAAALWPQVSQAHPYASGVTVSGSTVSFILNESGGNVTVKYEDGSTNANFNGFSTGTNVASGLQSFSVAGHTSYTISVAKAGNGVPSLISVDTNVFCVWPTPRGLGVSQNPQNGALFGRVYVSEGNQAIAGSVVNPPYNAAPYLKSYPGLYALNADLSDSPLGYGTNASGVGIFAAAATASGSSSTPYRIRVAPDGTLYVGDMTSAGAALWQFASDLTSSNLVLGPVGNAAGQAAVVHGELFGTPYVTGSIAQSNLVVWTGDNTLPVPTNSILGPNTSAGQYNCIYRYTIGAGPLPWTNAPDYAYNEGLAGIATLRPELEIGKDGKIIAGFGRANYSNPDLQILDPSGATLLYLSGDNGGNPPPLNQNNGPSTGSDLWNGVSTASGAVGTYCGVRVSPDGRFLASVDADNNITLATLTNGIPNDTSIFAINDPGWNTNYNAIGNTNFPAGGGPYTANSRGMSWDAADNIYVISSGTALLRVFSLGISTTCITSNDITGTNGSFQLIVPNTTATVAASTPQASQNYINSLPAGTPTPGVFTISLNQTTLSGPVIVKFTRGGTAAYLTNYTIALGTDANGVIISSNSVTFPAGTYPGGGNWQANVQITPTATPLTGPSLTVVLTVLGGPNYVQGVPGNATVAIANTGPQLLLLSAASSGTTMSRNVPNDYAEFVITRYGDTNGPGNNATQPVSQVPYTVTNFTYLGTAAYPADYTAQAQNASPPPVNGTPGIVIAPGVVNVTNLVGNPVAHANLNLPPTNVTITISLTNLVTGTNATSQQGYAYSVNTNAVTLTELDNTIGPEVVIYSNPLTNSFDSTNWTLTFDTPILSTSNTVLPVVVPNYTNGESSIAAGGTNDFRVNFGYPIANDGISPSPDMLANGWSNVLKMTVNKDGDAAVAAVNLYQQGINFQGNHALRFSMYLSIWSSAINNPFAGTTPREFALFGINHAGTNCNWRPATPIPAGTGNGPTNADGVWFAIDAGDDSITPADFDAFTSPALPNAGVTADVVSMNGVQNNGIFKNPPFTTMTPAGGEPVDRWVDVSVEVTGQTNVNVYMNRSPVLPSFTLTNLTASGGGNSSYTSGTIMLGYLDPVADVSDSTAFAYYSNVRVVELSPYITAQPVSLIATQGQNVAFSSSASFATAPITNVWFLGNTNPVVAVQTNTASATNLTSTLNLNNVQGGTNYVSVFSDIAGSVTGLVVNLEVIAGPASITTNTGATIQFAVTASGQSAPTSYQWKTNGVNLANSAHYAGVATSTLTINNVAQSDAGTYSVAVTNAAGGVAPSATLLVNVPLPPAISTVSLVGTNLVLAFTSPNAYDTSTSFILQSSLLVQGPYANANPPGTFTGSSGSFQVTVPISTSGNMFYRLKHI